MRQKQLWLSFFAFILLCALVELVGGAWTRESVGTWYPKLIKPSWTPPAWVFGPVWSCLYLMIAVSGWLLYRAEYSQQRRLALLFYSAQLVLNFAWSFLFFFLQSPLLGLIDIALLCLAVMLTIYKAWPLHRTAALLLVPYLLWVLYAASLNAGIWLLN